MAIRKPIPVATKVKNLKRDAWLCRWCGKPTLCHQALKYSQMMLVDEGYTGLAHWHHNYSRAGGPLLDELAAVIDHIETHSSFGASEAPDIFENLVTACNKCNAKKSNKTLDQWKDETPKARKSDPNDWDGLASLFVVLGSGRYAEKLTASDKEWLKALCVHYPAPKV